MAWEQREYYRSERPSGGGGGLRFLLPSTRLALVLMAVNLGIFVIQALTAPVAGLSPLIYWGALSADLSAVTQPWRWITYQYLHGDGGHVFFNLITTYFFVPVLEQRWGWKRTLAFYTAGGIFAGVAFQIICAFTGFAYLIGASGSLLSVLGAIAVIAPHMQILMMMVVPITMRVLAILFGILYLLTILGDRNKSDAAHLGGLLFGAGVVYFAGPWWSRTSNLLRMKRSRSALRQERQDNEQVDRILQKVHDTGMNSLTRWEKKVLKRATERQRVSELSRSHR